MNIEEIARAAHEANREFCLSLGDTSQVPWDEAPDNIKQSAIDGVKYFIDNPGVTPQDMHNNWTKFKLQDGWVYGPTKDAEKKTHPSLVPYSQLSHTERMKDDIFVATVTSYLNESTDEF